MLQTRVVSAEEVSQSRNTPSKGNCIKENRPTGRRAVVCGKISEERDDANVSLGGVCAMTVRGLLHTAACKHWSVGASTCLVHSSKPPDETQQQQRLFSPPASSNSWTSWALKKDGWYVVPRMTVWSRRWLGAMSRSRSGGHKMVKERDEILVRKDTRTTLVGDPQGTRRSRRKTGHNRRLGRCLCWWFPDHHEKRRIAECVCGNQEEMEVLRGRVRHHRQGNEVLRLWGDGYERWRFFVEAGRICEVS